MRTTSSGGSPTSVAARPMLDPGGSAIRTGTAGTPSRLQTNLETRALVKSSTTPSPGPAGPVSASTAGLPRHGSRDQHHDEEPDRDRDHPEPVHAVGQPTLHAECGVDHRIGRVTAT
jgi:hypothetical protein